MGITVDTSLTNVGRFDALLHFSLAVTLIGIVLAQLK